MSASYLILTYASEIIEKSGTQLSQQFSSISLACMQILATSISIQLVDRKGRKFLLIYSLLGCSIGHAVMSAYLYLHDSKIDVSLFNWLPVVCLAFIVLMASIGIIPLTLICTVEFFDAKVRAIGLTFSNVALNLITFLVAKVYPVLVEDIGLANCLSIFCVTCILGTAYIILYVEETTGKEINVVKSDDEELEI